MLCFKDGCTSSLMTISSMTCLRPSARTGITSLSSSNRTPARIPRRFTRVLNTGKTKPIGFKDSSTRSATSSTEQVKEKAPRTRTLRAPRSLNIGIEVLRRGKAPHSMGSTKAAIRWGHATTGEPRVARCCPSKSEAHGISGPAASSPRKGPAPRMALSPKAGTCGGRIGFRSCVRWHVRQVRLQHFQPATGRLCAGHRCQRLRGPK